MTEPGREAWVTQQLGGIPPETDAALVMRHAEREDIPPGTFGSEVPLTEHGVASAERLGAMLSGMRPQIRATTSPVPRCDSTARAILRSGGLPEEIAPDWRLGAPGPFVVDEEASGALFLEIGVLEMVRRQLVCPEPQAGMRPTPEGMCLLLGLTADDLQCRGRLNIYVTHDSILAALVAYLYGLSVDDISWPGYLDALFLWRRGERLHYVWKGLEQGSHPFSGHPDGFPG